MRQLVPDSRTLITLDQNFRDSTHCRTTTRFPDASSFRNTTLLPANTTNLLNTTHGVFTSSQEVCRLVIVVVLVIVLVVVVGIIIVVIVGTTPQFLHHVLGGGVAWKQKNQKVAISDNGFVWVLDQGSVLGFGLVSWGVV